MSKIAETKALKAYPYLNEERRKIYINGYNQAMQDFMEKAERWLEPTFKHIVGYNCGGDLMNDFENYMQDESEN